MSTKETKLTPAMKQYYEMKSQYEDTILFFRMGDFYEMFDEDARIVSRELGLTLTSRNKNSDNPIPLAGIPYHAADKYIAELTRKGYKVTISEQVSDPSLPGIVQRAVTQVVTPGTTLQTEVLDAKGHNFLAAVTGQFSRCGLSFLDLSTGMWHVTECMSYEAALEELTLKAPKEILVHAGFFNKAECITDLQKRGFFVQEYNYTENPVDILSSHFHIQSLSVLGLEHKQEAVSAAALALTYAYNTQKTEPQYLHPVKFYNKEGTMLLDISVVRNLELFATSRDGEKKGSLLHLIDQTVTGGGGRLLRQWMMAPELDVHIISDRHDAVEFFYRDPELRKVLRSHLAHTADLERVLARLSLGRGNARDLLSIANTLEALISIRNIFEKETPPKLVSHVSSMFARRELQQIMEYIRNAISPEAGVEISMGNIIREGFDEEVDTLRGLKQKAKEWMMNYQKEEQEKTGISQLKVKFTSVFGYFLEIPKSQEQKVPAHYVRKQTLVGAERYITDELKVFEEKVMTSEEKAAAREYAIFLEVREAVLKEISLLQDIAYQYSLIDLLSCFAELSYKEQYARPVFTKERSLEIEEGRHPVIAALLREQKEVYVPNDIRLIENKEEFLLITGPNMAGKSTYLRQVALTSYLAQIGCFVPAKKAVLPIYDRIFTRVGAADNMSKGESTFMVEMQEASFILHNATAQSLIILDEIGRGTSTYDGLSLAWSIMKYIHNNVHAHTLFATHYHELIDVAEELPKAKNYSVAIAETESGVVFLHKIIEGGASESYGIEVARLAGMPREVLSDAQIYLQELEANEKKKTNAVHQDSLFTIVERTTPQEIENIVTSLATTDINSLTPLQAMEKLAMLIAEARKV